MFKVRYVIFLFLLINSSILFAQEPNDCINAIAICGNINFTYTPTGPGADDFLTNPNPDCLSTDPVEAQSVWLQITIDNPGSLEFVIAPNNGTDDYDWAIYGPGVTCNNIGNAIRCSSTMFISSNSGATGLGNGATDTTEGPGTGDAFLLPLDVNAGETYYLFINNWSNSSSGFQLDFGGTATFNEPPTIEVPIGVSIDIEQCDTDGVLDNQSTFDLTVNTPIILGAQTGLNVAYFINLGDAQIDNNPILNPTSFSNTTNPQTIYVRVTNVATGCFDTTEFLIFVENSLNIGAPNDLFICDDNNDGFAQFDLSQNDTLIQNGELNTIITYHESEADAIIGINDLSILYTNSAAYTQEIIWSRLLSILTGCFQVVSFTIEVFDTPTANMVNNILQCDDNNDGVSDFDLTSTEVDVLGTQDATQFTIAYHITQADATADINAIPNPVTFTNTSNPQTIYVRIDNNDNNDCFDTTSFSIEVFDTPTANTAIDFEQCDNLDDGDDTNGEVTFDLSTKINEVLGTQLFADFEVKFYYTQAEADVGLAGTEITTPIQNTSTPQSIVARIENRLNTDCYDTTSFNLIVFELPVVLPLVELYQCDDNTDGFSNFNLEEANEIISTNYINEFFTYHTTLTDAENGLNAIPNETTYVNIDPSATPDILYVRIENANGCYRTSQLNLLVSTTQIPANFQLNYEVCDDTLLDGDDRNGVAAFDFSDADTQITSLFPMGQTLTITYYETLGDALQETNAIADISNHRNDLSPDVQTIFVRVDSDIDNACLGLGEHITLTVNPLPIIDLEDEYLLCVNTNGTEEVDLPLIDTGLSNTAYSFEWSLNNTVITGFTGASYVPTQGGEYSVLVTNNITGCQDIDSTIVNESEPPTVTAELTSLAFADNHVIEATAIGSGVYEYSLDGGPWQESGIFENVSPGEHIVTARDVNGCGIDSVIVIVIDYPLYFTPNGDGFNDTWNIVGIENQPNAKIYIFNRYGKLLKQITPMGNGWNGTYNGNRLPTNDYWFTVEYDEPSNGTRKQFKAHFSLKR